MGQQQYLRITSFGGQSRHEDSYKVQPDQFLRMDNFVGNSDPNSVDFYGILTKAPAKTNQFNAIANRRTRGVVEFFPSANDFDVLLPQTLPFRLGGISEDTEYTVFQAVADNPVTTLEFFGARSSTGTWTAIDPPAGTPMYFSHVDMEFMTRKLYVTVWDRLLKWHGRLIAPVDSLEVSVDKGGTAIALTGNLTFTNTSRTVLGAATSFTTELRAGDWIRGTSTEAYFEVESITNNTELLLREAYVGTTGAKGVGLSQQAPDLLDNIGFFVKEFQDRMFMYGSGPFRSTLAWSTAGDPENWSGYGSGAIPISEDDGTIASGLGKHHDYLLVFKEKSYHVYRHNANSPTLPITFVKTFPYGCTSERTIQNIESGVLYFTGRELRLTNGISDISVSDEMREEFLRSINARAISYYFQQGAEDDEYPSAAISERRHVYKIALTSVPQVFLPVVLPFQLGGEPGDRIFNYDYKENRWIGNENDLSAGSMFTLLNISADDIGFSRATPGSVQLRTWNEDSLDATVDGILKSPHYDFGFPSKLKKIHYVEFLFHPWDSCNTVITFRKFLDDVQNTETEAFTLTAAVGATDAMVRKRFTIWAKECNRFAWQISDDPTASGFSIMEITIAYEILDSP